MNRTGAQPSAPAPDPAATGYGESSPFRLAREDPLLTRLLPVAGEVPHYRVPSARRDLVAGVTVAALAIPAAMAYAEVAGRLAGQRALRGAAAGRRVRRCSARRGSSWSARRARSRRSSARRFSPLAVAGSARRGRAGRDARAARRGVLRARVAAAARLDRRLLLAAGADRLHPRRRRHPRDRPARQAARAVDRRARPAAAAVGGDRRSSASVSGATVAVCGVVAGVAVRAALLRCRGCRRR